MFLVSALFVYALLKSRLAFGWGMLALVFSVVTIGLTFDYLGYDKVNEVSSGRLSLYEYQLGKHLVDRPLDEWLVGSQTFLSGEKTLVANEDISKGGFSRNQTDNGYLSILLSHGILGLSFFAFPLAILGWTLYVRARYGSGPATKYTRLGFAVLVALALTSLTESTIPSLGGILAIYTPLFWTPVLDIRWNTDGLSRQRRTTAPMPIGRHEVLAQKG